MVQLIRFPLEAGGSVLVEVEEAEGAGAVRVGLDETIQTAGSTFEKSLEILKPVTNAIMQTMHDLRPQEVSAEFGFKMSMEQGVIIAKAGGEANFKVTLTWKQETPAQS